VEKKGADRLMFWTSAFKSQHWIRQSNATRVENN